MCVVIQIEVMTASDQWTVLRRYSDFVTLQQKLSRLHAMRKDLLPGKRLMGRLSAEVIEQRRNGLERYLQRLINSNKEVVFSPPLLEFLDVDSHNVIKVSDELARLLHQQGTVLLEQGGPFALTPTQCRCISRRLNFPYDYKIQALHGDMVEATPGTPGDLANLFDFVCLHQHLRVHPTLNAELPPEQQPLEATAADLSIWKSLRILEIKHCRASLLVPGLHGLHTDMLTLRTQHAGVSTMAEIIQTVASERRAAPEPRAGADQWRQASLHRLVDKRLTYHPWLALVHLDMSHNQLEAVDPQSLRLLPSLEKLDLGYNQIFSLMTWLEEGTVMPTLRRVNLSHNHIARLVLLLDMRKESVSTVSVCSTSSAHASSPLATPTINMSPG